MKKIIFTLLILIVFCFCNYNISYSQNLFDDFKEAELVFQNDLVDRVSIAFKKSETELIMMTFTETIELINYNVETNEITKETILEELHSNHLIQENEAPYNYFIKNGELYLYFGLRKYMSLEDKDIFEKDPYNNNIFGSLTNDLTYFITEATVNLNNLSEQEFKIIFASNIDEYDHSNYQRKIFEDETITAVKNIVDPKNKVAIKDLPFDYILTKDIFHLFNSQDSSKKAICEFFAIDQNFYLRTTKFNIDNQIESHKIFTLNKNYEDLKHIEIKFIEIDPENNLIFILDIYDEENKTRTLETYKITDDINITSSSTKLHYEIDGEEEYLIKDFVVLNQDHDKIELFAISNYPNSSSLFSSSDQSLVSGLYLMEYRRSDNTLKVKEKLLTEDDGIEINDNSILPPRYQEQRFFDDGQKLRISQINHAVYFEDKILLFGENRYVDLQIGRGNNPSSASNIGKPGINSQTYTKSKHYERIALRDINTIMLDTNLNVLWNHRVEPRNQNLIFNRRLEGLNANTFTMNTDRYNIIFPNHFYSQPQYKNNIMSYYFSNDEDYFHRVEYDAKTGEELSFYSFSYDDLLFYPRFVFEFEEHLVAIPFDFRLEDFKWSFKRLKRYYSKIHKYKMIKK